MATSSSAPGRVEITNRVIDAGHESYQIRNITRIGKYEYRPNNAGSYKAILIGVISIMGSLFAIYKRGEMGWLWVTLFGVMCVIGGVSFIRRKYFGLSIETNSGSANVLQSKDEALIDALVKTIRNIMNNEDIPANYTVNVNKGNIMNNISNEEISIKDNAGSININKGNRNVIMNNEYKERKTHEIEALIEKLKEIASHYDGAPNKKISELDKILKTDGEKKEKIREIWQEICRAMPAASAIMMTFEKILNMSDV